MRASKIKTVSIHSPPSSPGNNNLNDEIGTNANNNHFKRDRIYRSFSRQVPGQTRWLTREIAALDFLLNIPLKEEREIVRAGLEGRTYRRKIQNPKDSQTSVDPDKSLHNTETIASTGITPVSSQTDLTSLVTKGADIEDVTALNTAAEDNISSKGGKDGARWWEKLMLKEKSFFIEENQKRATLQKQLELEQELELPDSKIEKINNDLDQKQMHIKISEHESEHQQSQQLNTPGRRLDGSHATIIKVPQPPSTARTTRQRDIARNAFIRQWEKRVAHGIGNSTKQPDSSSQSSSINSNINEEYQNVPDKALLDGRIFFSAQKGYPIGVFSVVKYEPKKEEAARRRKKLEEMGGGGTKFAVPTRDWRGTSYRSLLRRVQKRNKSFQRIMDKTVKELRETENANTFSKSVPDTSNYQTRSINVSSFDNSKNVTSYSSDDESISSTSSSSSSSSEGYLSGFLDDPTMVQGRHRHVMFGDRITGPIVSSTIQFVKPTELKANLNKQFRERFDGWEPPKKRWGLIGARVIDGVYTLMDFGEDEKRNGKEDMIDEARNSGGVILDGTQHSTANKSNEQKDVNFRMPPSLTLSKIRSIKQQALYFCVQKTNLEVSTVALACVYFERLCLDCRVDKSNRRLTFASCLLLAVKINEANVVLVHKTDSKTTDNINVEKNSGTSKTKAILKAFVRPTKRSSNMFASLLEFFTNDWNLNLQNLFAAEWGVFAALGFRLHVSPVHVAFHFKRLMKVLERAPLNYIGLEMYDQWQQCLIEDELRREEHEVRIRVRKERKERKLIKLRRNLQRKISVGSERSSSEKVPDLSKDRENTDESLQKDKHRNRVNFSVDAIPIEGSKSFAERRSSSTGNLKSLTPKKEDLKAGTAGTKKIWSRWRNIKPQPSQNASMAPYSMGGFEKNYFTRKSSLLRKSASSSVLSDMMSNVETLTDDRESNQDDQLKQTIGPLSYLPSNSPRENHKVEKQNEENVLTSLSKDDHRSWEK